MNILPHISAHNNTISLHRNLFLHYLFVCVALNWFIAKWLKLSYLFFSIFVGNDVIHELTKANTSSLYVTITLTNGTTLFELHETFSIASELDNYRLFIGGQASGTLGNQLMTGSRDSGTNLNGMMFSTLDRDNDNCYGSCASDYKGGWWFSCCHYAYLNGLYNTSNWLRPWYPTVSIGTMLQKTSMMIRRR